MVREKINIINYPHLVKNLEKELLTIELIIYQ